MDMPVIGDILLSPLRIVGGFAEIGYRLIRGSSSKEDDVSDLVKKNDTNCIRSTAFILENRTDNPIQILKIVSIQDGVAYDHSDCPIHISPRGFKEVTVPMGGKNLGITVLYEICKHTRSVDFTLCEDKGED